MRAIVGIAVLVACLTSLAAVDLAASSYEGKVIAVDSLSNQITVQTPTGTNSMIFVSDPQTAILTGNGTKVLSDVHVGDTVKIGYTAAEGTNTATDIEVVAGAAGAVHGSTDVAQNTAPSGSDYDRAPNPSTTPPAQSTHSDTSSLPRTGSSLPLVGLAGLALVGLAIGVRAFRFLIS